MSKNYINIKKCVHCQHSLTTKEYFNPIGTCPHCGHHASGNMAGHTYDSTVRDRRQKSGPVYLVWVFIIIVIVGVAHA